MLPVMDLSNLMDELNAPTPTQEMMLIDRALEDGLKARTVRLRLHLPAVPGAHARTYFVDAVMTAQQQHKVLADRRAALERML